MSPSSIATQRGCDRLENQSTVILMPWQPWQSWIQIWPQAITLFFRELSFVSSTKTQFSLLLPQFPQIFNLIFDTKELVLLSCQLTMWFSLHANQWFFTKSKAKKNEFVFKPVDEGSLIVPELECCPITFWLAEDWSARAGRGVLQIPTGTAKFRPNFSIWCLFGFNSSSPVLYVKLCCNYFILFFPSVLKFWCSKYFIASLTWSCSHWYMGRENRIGIETQKRLLSSYAIWLNKNFQVNTFTGFFGQNKTQVPKNSKLKQDTEKNSRKIPKTQITATPVFSKLSNTFSNFWKYFKNSWKDLKT